MSEKKNEIIKEIKKSKYDPEIKTSLIRATNKLNWYAIGAITSDEKSILKQDLEYIASVGIQIESDILHSRLLLSELERWENDPVMRKKIFEGWLTGLRGILNTVQTLAQLAVKGDQSENEFAEALHSLPSYQALNPSETTKKESKKTNADPVLEKREFNFGGDVKGSDVQKRRRQLWGLDKE